jgi:MFS transporter, DHA3 family, macrolide efflux protein
MPAQTILIRTIVPMNGLMAANALMMQVAQVTQIVIPGIAGLLVSHIGAAVCFWLDSASFLFSAAMVLTIPFTCRAGPAVKEVSSVLAELTFGSRYIFTHRVLAFAVLSMAAASFAASCYGALIATYVRDILHGFAGLYGILGTLVGVGMILGTHAMTRFGRASSKEHLIMMGLPGVALSISLLAIFGNTPLAVVATLGTGFGVALVIIPAQTLIQSVTPVEILGRVSGSLRSVVALVQTGGLVLAGSIEQALGIRTAYFAISALLLLIASMGLRVAQTPNRSYIFSRSTRR